MFKHFRAPFFPLVIFLLLTIILTGGCALEKPESESDATAQRAVVGSAPVIAAAGSGSGFSVVPVFISRLSGSAGTGVGATAEKINKPLLQAPLTGSSATFALGLVEVFSQGGEKIAEGNADDSGAFSLDVPAGENYFVLVTDAGGTASVRGYIPSITGEGLSDFEVNAISSSVVYAMEEYLELPNDIFSGYAGSANLSAIADQLVAHGEMPALLELVQAEIVAGNIMGLTQPTLDFLASHFLNTPPTVQISEPLDGMTFSECEIVSFRAAANDSEDGLLHNSSLSWESDLSGVFARGEFLVTSILPPGVHTISVTANDIGAKASTSFIIVTILESSGGWCSASAGGLHSLAIRGDETLWGWGFFGTLNDGSIVFDESPSQIGHDADWRSVTTGDSTSFAIKMDGSLWSWGKANNFAIAPNLVDEANDWFSISAGLWHQVGRKYDGSLWGWGENSSGQLGDSTYDSKSNPVMIGVSREWKEVFAGYRHTVALKTDGTIWAWGQNSLGQLGDGTYFTRNFPVQAGSGNDWVSVSTLGNHNLALKSDGTIWGWGQDHSCQLGIGCAGMRNFPVQIGFDSDWTAVFAGPADSFAIKSDGTLWGWGKNSWHELGDVRGYSLPRMTNIVAPGQIGAEADWAEVYSGRYHTLALKRDGTLVAWGRNQNGTSDVVE